MSNYQSLIETGNTANRQQATDRAEKVRWFLEPLVRNGWSLTAMTKSLNAYRIKTLSGTGRWSKSMTQRALSRLGLSMKQAA